MLSEYSKADPSFHGQVALTPNLYNKTKYVLYLRNLQLYTQELKFGRYTGYWHSTKRLILHHTFYSTQKNVSRHAQILKKIYINYLLTACLVKQSSSYVHAHGTHTGGSRCSDSRCSDNRCSDSRCSDNRYSDKLAILAAQWQRDICSPRPSAG